MSNDPRDPLELSGSVGQESGEGVVLAAPCSGGTALSPGAGHTALIDGCPDFAAPLLRGREQPEARPPRTQKQRTPTPQDLETLIAEELVPRLMLAHRVAPPHAGSGDVSPVEAIHADDHDVFLHAVIGETSDEAELLLDGLRDRGVSTATILMDLFATTARRLGEMWDSDDADLTDVTVAVCRLHRLLREGDWRDGSSVTGPVNAPTVLLTTLAADQHMLGISIIAEFFRQAGWRVRVETGKSTADVGGVLSAQYIDVIAVSASQKSCLASAAAEIDSLRNASRNKDVKIIVGGTAFGDMVDPDARYGADAFVADARDVVAYAATLARWHEAAE